MDQLVEITSMKSESTESRSSDRLEIPSEMQKKNIKQESESVIPLEIYIKTEPKEDESELLVTVDTFDKMCTDDDNEFKMYEPIVNIEMENSEDEMMHDSLALKTESKVAVGNKEHLSSDLEDDKKYNTEKEESSKNGSKNKNQLFRKIKQNCKTKEHTCHVCSKIFTRKSSLNVHLRIHSGSQPFTCDLCKKSFNQKSNLNTHIMLIHSGEKPYACDLCNKRFRYISLLNDHKLIHSGVKLFSCYECDKTFENKHNLLRHRQTHTNEKPFSCDLCDKKFARKSHITKHRRTHTGEKPYSCEICNKSFSRKDVLNNHRRNYQH